MTNAEKFKEVFGVYPAKSQCPLFIACSECKYKHRQGCSYYFWNDEYKDTHLEEDYSEFSE
jgi:hypothetical protein